MVTQTTTKMKQNFFIEAFVKSGCNVTQACKKVPIERKTYYNWCKKSPKFKQAVLDSWEKRKDFVEGKIMQHIKDDNITMTIFWAKTQMKDRGYVERQDINIEGKIDHGHDVLISAFKKRENEIESAVQSQIEANKENPSIVKDSVSRVDKSDVTKESWEKEEDFNSSNVKSYAYNKELNKLRVWFMSNAYVYYEYDCTLEECDALNKATSKGNYISYIFRGRKFKKVEE